MMLNLRQKVLLNFAKLPLSVLYMLSDGMSFLQNNLIKYRSDTVIENLSIAFPNASSNQKKKWLNAFNRQLCDYAVESLKLIQIEPQSLSELTSTVNFKVFDEIKKEGKNCVLLSGHVFNWEYLIDMVPAFPVDHTYAVYHEISNPLFNDILIKSRSKFGTIPLKMQHVIKKMLSAPRDGNSMFLFVADQRPHRSKISHSLSFFGKDTPVFNGYDKLTRKTNSAVVYTDITKTARGHYQFNFKRILPTEENFKPNEIVEKYYGLLEENIKSNPPNWLWTHKRWKYKKGIDY